MATPSTTRPAARVPLGFRVLPRRVHYAWWICLGCATLMFVTVGVGYYGLAVFLRPLQEENGWSNAAVSGATGLYFSLSGLTGYLVGPHIDRRGPLRFMTAGVMLLGTASISIGYVSALWQLYLAYAVLATGFGMATSVAVQAIMTRWFVTRRAKAMSVTFTGISLGGVILAPVGSALIGIGGVRLATTVMGLAGMALALPIVLFVLAWDPAELGLEPDAGSPDESVNNEAMSDRVQRRVWTRAEAQQTTAFWAILIGFLVILLAQTGVLLHQLAFLEDRFGSRNAAAFALSTTAFGSIVARLVVGQFADRADKRILAMWLFVIQGSAVALLALFDNRVLTYALVLVIGFTIGNVYMMQTLLTSEIFGLVSMGTVYGVIALAGQTGSGLGPFIVGWMEDATGSYRIPFLIMAGLTYAAAGIIRFANVSS